jgi:hypothetical protein
MENNSCHLLLRYAQRVGVRHNEELCAVLYSIDKMAKLRKLPNCLWYRGVRAKTTGKIVCYVCGTGNYVATILAANMAPKGKEV